MEDPITEAAAMAPLIHPNKASLPDLSPSTASAIDNVPEHSYPVQQENGQNSASNIFITPSETASVTSTSEIGLNIENNFEDNIENNIKNNIENNVENNLEHDDDDIETLTSLQFQGYIQDLDEAEAVAQEEAHVALAAEASHYSLAQEHHNPNAHNTYHPNPHLQEQQWPGLLQTPEFVSEQDTSLGAFATLTGAPASLPGLLNHLLPSVPVQNGVQRLESLQHALELEEGAEDDDDEECLRPSETKYILYDDDIPPVTVEEALATLNEILEEDLLLAEKLRRCGMDDTLVDGIYDSSEEGCSRSSPPSLGLIQQQLQEHGVLERLEVHLGGGQQGVGRRNRMIPLQRTDMEMGNGLLSPEIASPLSGHSSVLQDEDEFYADGSLQEEGNGSGASNSKGPDIMLNLAGNTLTPITIHDLFFSRHYPRLVYLSLWDTNLGIWGAQAVGGLMADRSCRIEYLNLGRNRLGFEGIVQLSGLYKNHSLVELDLSENHLDAKAVHSLQQIMVRLQKDRACNIRRLKLADNEINDVGCISIAKIIMGTVLSHLDLSGNRISDWGASTILASFESNTVSLRDISMEGNPLSFAGGVDICKILALPESKITHLNLSGAKVTDVGVPSLVDALKSHSCVLASLNLYDCQLTDTGILKIAVKLSVNKSLKVLGLGYNCIGDVGIMALSQALCLNNTLEELDLSDNDQPLSRAGLEALMSAMTMNTTLVDLRLDVDGHPHVQTGGYDEYNVIPGLNLEHGDETTDQAQDANGVHQHQQGLHQEQVHPEAPPVLAPVAEILAPTHHATIMGPPVSAPLTAYGEIMHQQQAQYQQQNHHQQQQQQQQQTHHQAHPQTGAVAEEQDLEQEREQLVLALSSLKAYVRHNYKRTERMRRLCFQLLVGTRILMFAKDGGGSAWAGKAKERSSTTKIGISATEVLEDEDETCVSNVAKEGLRGTLAGLPWEIKELILRAMDEEGLLSERQFQRIVQYGSTPQWETVRQPWDLWGEVRESILEKMRCYYYETPTRH
ncbi:NACHT, LRR and PYD domains-containing protein 14 [Podila epigama]|nr:NACHT, LRR and PYD domains-containing protein 14 [Podila epigama]